MGTHLDRAKRERKREKNREKPSNREILHQHIRK